MRERIAFRGTVDTLTSESKGSAKVLTGLPVVVFGALYVMNPGFLEPLLATDFGHRLIGLAIGLLVTGYFAMMKLADIEI
jgi:tight adherence protein B